MPPEVRQNITIDDSARIVHVLSNGRAAHHPKSHGKSTFIAPPGVIVIESDAEERTIEISNGQRQVVEAAIKMPNGVKFNLQIKKTQAVKLVLLKGLTEFVFTPVNPDGNNYFIELCWVRDHTNDAAKIADAANKNNCGKSAVETQSPDDPRADHAGTDAAPAPAATNTPAPEPAQKPAPAKRTTRRRKTTNNGQDA